MGILNWFDRKSPLAEAIARGTAPAGSLRKELDALDETIVRSRADGEAICKGLEAVLKQSGPITGGFAPLVNLFQKVESATAPAVPVLLRRAVPLLLKIVKEASDHPTRFDETDILVCLKTLAVIGLPDAGSAILRTAQVGFAADNYLWSIILEVCANDTDLASMIFPKLSAEIPPGFIAVSLMDAANQVKLNGGEDHHPFDSESGVTRITQWLADRDEENFSYARSCTVALPFLTDSRRDALLAAAMAHPAPDVKIEAAWAAAKLDHPLGAENLAALCLDVNLSQRARKYLTELGLEESIPPESRQPDFEALAEFAEWIAHPNELGRPPDELTIRDHRILNWPPTFAPRKLWLIHYHVRAASDLQDDDEGIGLAGSVTFSLFGSELLELPPEDGYAIHCCWELGGDKLLTVEPVTSAEYDAHLQQWTGVPLEETAIEQIAEISPDLKYPRRLVAIASARKARESGWVVLDEGDSQWYAAADFPAETRAKTVLNIHLGRRLLKLPETGDRRSFFRPKQPKSPEPFMTAYESLVKKAAEGAFEEQEDLLGKRSDLSRYFVPYLDAVQAVRGGKRSELLVGLYEKIRQIARRSQVDPSKYLDCFSPLGDQFSAYTQALSELGKKVQITEEINLFEPYLQHNLGYSLLGKAAFHAGDEDRAEQFLLKLKQGLADWKGGSEMPILAEIWFRKGRSNEAKDLLLQLLEKQVEDAKDSWVQDRPLLEKRYAALRDVFVRLFSRRLRRQ